MDKLEKISDKITIWIGTPISIIIHTILFVTIFLLKYFGVSIDQILLILTTAVSLEAIYLAIFIQMSVNKTKLTIAGVEKDIDDIQEDIEDISEDDEDEMIDTIKDIEEKIVKLHKEIIEIKENKPHTGSNKFPVNR